MDSQPVSGLPALFGLAESEIEEMTSEIKTLGKELKGIKKRIKAMALFADRNGHHGFLKRSEVGLDSSPEEEMLYQHRRQYEIAAGAMERVLENMAKMTPLPEDVREYHQAVQTMRLMQKEANEHLRDMRNIQKDLRRRESDIEGRLINIIQERARMLLRMMEHHDKMDIARSATEIPTSAQLQERLASKYGVSVDQVEKLIAAKQADAEVQA